MNQDGGVVYVAIGRNEGARLVACLASLPCRESVVVYVDSGSTDQSIEAARAAGAHVVELDMSRPFTAARARNAGFERAKALAPQADYVQFIDGDCELVGGWVDAARQCFLSDTRRGIVAGRCREKNREGSIYNRIADLEWDGPIGEIRACGGIFMIESALFDAVGGFDESVIAAEDDELCIRVRRAGRLVLRTASEMCRHDVAISRFSQWWMRALRAGCAFGQVGAMHAGYFSGEKRRALFWGLALPSTALMLALFTSGWGLALLAAYPLAALRLRSKFIRQGMAARDATVYGAFLTFAKTPNALGLLKFWINRWMSRAPAIIEYK